MKKTLIKISLSIGLVCMLSSCDKDFVEINKSVDFVSEPNLDFVLPDIELTLTDNTYYGIVDYVAAMVGQVTQGKSYQSLIAVGDDNAALHYTWIYKNAFKNVVDMIDRSKGDASKVNYYNIGRILKVYMAHQLTDTFGDVPYFEAGKGYSEHLLTPNFDSQQKIYEDMFNELQDAAVALDNTKPTPKTSDIVYHGDLTKWKKFSYSLMLRLGLRIMDVDPINGKKWIDKAIAGGVLTSNDDNFIVYYLPNTDAAGTSNPTSNGSMKIFQKYPDKYRLSSPFVDVLKSRNDPRTSIYCMLPASLTKYGTGDKTPGRQKGYPMFGSITESKLNFSVANNSTFGKYDAPYVHLSYAEVEYQLAECVVRGIITGDAKTYYENGVRAAMDEMKIYGSEGVITVAQANNYLQLNPFNPSKDAALEMINTQYWIETHYNWYETFANMRRSGYPKIYDQLDQTVTANQGAVLPNRLVYPPLEIAANPHTQEAIQRQGPNLTSTRIWWQKK